MYQRMVLKDVAGSEGLAASTTDVGALIGVGTLMLHARGVVCEAAATVLTCKRSLSGVLAHVAFQLGSCAEARLTESENKSI